MSEDTMRRVSLVMVEEVTIDNLMYARENMEKEYKLRPENISDIIAILINYWFDNKRSL